MSMDMDSINHVGMAVQSLADAAHRYEKMGFMLTPYSPHSGAARPGDPVVAYRSGNRCVMFRNNYLEILGSEHADAPNERIAGFLRRHQGAHIICFNTDDTHEVNRRLQSQDIGTSGVLPLQRDIDTPEGVRTAQFERVLFSPEDSAEGQIQAARHLTPEYIYQPRYIAHPNKVVALSNVFLVTGEPDALANRYARYLGSKATRVGAARVFGFPLVSKLSIIAGDDVRTVLPGTLMPPMPCIAGIAMATTDLAAVRARLSNNGVRFVDEQQRLVVPAEEACGIAIVFEHA
jgi:hypothetical protein